MRIIWVAGRALLRAVRLHRKNICAVESLLVRVRVIGLDPLDQFELPNHRGFLAAALGVRHPIGADRNDTNVASGRHVGVEPTASPYTETTLYVLGQLARVMP